MIKFLISQNCRYFEFVAKNYYSNLSLSYCNSYENREDLNHHFAIPKLFKKIYKISNLLIF